MVIECFVNPQGAEARARAETEGVVLGNRDGNFHGVCFNKRAMNARRGLIETSNVAL